MITFKTRHHPHLRNWMIGCYISEYELNGAYLAVYGERLMDKLADSLGKMGVSRSDIRELRRYRQFCATYPKIRETLTPELRVRSPAFIKLPTARPKWNPALNF